MSLLAARAKVALSPARATPRPTTLSSRALTLALLAFFLINALVLNAVIWTASPEPNKTTVLKHTMDVLKGEGGDDSWGAMQVALDHVAQLPDTPLYSKVFFTDHYRFQYPPSALFALSAMLALDPARVQVTDAYEGPWPATNTIAGWLFIALTAAATAALLEVSLAAFRPDVDWQPWRIGRSLVVACLTLTFYPVVKAFTLGQIQVWINALFALSLLAWATGWKVPSGLLIGIISLIKPHYGLFLVWAALRREARFAGACAATILVGLAASVAVYGLANHLDYVRVLSFLSQHGEAYYPNQSVNGLLNRVMSIFDPQSYVNLDLPAGQFPPFTAWIWAGTVASSLLLLLFALVVPLRWQRREPVLDLCLMAIACTMASPIAWEHHYGVALPVFAVLLAACLDNRLRLALAATCYVLMSTFVSAANLLAGTALNVFQSTLFAGALILLAVLASVAADVTGVRHRTSHLR